MNGSLRFALSALLAAALAGCGCAAGGRLLAAALGPLADLARLSEESERLQCAVSARHESSLLRAGLARDLAQGRLSLGAAIGRLRGRYVERDLEPVPGDSLEERLGRSLIRAAAGELPEGPGRAAVVARLEGELRDFLASGEEEARGLAASEPPHLPW